MTDFPPNQKKLPDDCKDGMRKLGYHYQDIYGKGFTFVTGVVGDLKVINFKDIAEISNFITNEQSKKTVDTKVS